MKKSLLCPKCGKKTPGDKFCPNCGASLVFEEPKFITVTLPNLKLIATIIVAIGAIAVIILATTGFFQTTTDLSLSLRFPPSACGEELTYSAELRDANSEPLANQLIYVYANDSLIEKLTTDHNGRISSIKAIPLEWCGKSINFMIRYNGDLLHKGTSSSSALAIFIPTELGVYVPEEVIANEEMDLSIILRNSVNDSPLANKPLIILNSVFESVNTNSNGRVELKLIFNETGKKTIKVRFGGDASYSGTESPLIEIDVKPQTCEDETIVGECSTKAIGYYCNEDKMLIFACSFCGCSQGLVCYDNTCITQEEQTTRLVNELQDSIVLVEHAHGLGSGVIINQKDGKTIILTNKHVIRDADRASAVTITTNDEKTAQAETIRVAPNGMDFAVIYVSGTYGEMARINYSEVYNKGQGVLALGSPLGLQGSVSEGIISNFYDDTTDTFYEYTAIQTDAAINPGNSGGGLFLKSSGNLIGINTFKYADVGIEGLNFAIELKELQRISNYESWGNFVPTLKCWDGTPYGQCSIIDEHYCNNGFLVLACEICGCNNPAYPHCATSGPSAGECFGCLYGATPYDDGTCCSSGWYRVDYLACCPLGTYYYDGMCYS